MAKNTSTRRKGSTKTTTATEETNATASTATADDVEVALDRIAIAHCSTGNAALNFYYTFPLAPLFIRQAIFAALDGAADKLKLPRFTDKGDQVEQFTRLITLFEATGENFTLEAKGGAK